MTTTTAHPLEIRLLGRTEILHGGEATNLPRSRKARALLGYLVTSGQAQSREHLCDLLWDGPADPRAELRWCLAKIRPLLNDNAATRLICTGDYVQFHPALAMVDVTAVRRLVPGTPESASLKDLQQASTLLRGPYLEGLEMPECYRFDAWCLAERQDLHRLRDGVLRTLVEQLWEQPELALQHARDRLLLDPLCEDAHTSLILLLHAMGRYAEAQERYEHCQRMLQQEFGRLPSPQLAQVRTTLRCTDAPPTTSSPALDNDVNAPPLVGRASELEVLLRAIGECMPVLVTGEPGIGKTRLLQEAALRMRKQGGTILRGRAFEVDRGRPYAPWIDAFRSIPTTCLPLREAVRFELAALLPELGSAAPDQGNRTRLFDAVVALLADMAADQRAVVVLLDDIQWLDEASAALLHYVARATAGHTVSLLSAARPGELECNPAARRLTRALRRDDILDVLPVAPLATTETIALAHSVAPQVDGCRVSREAEGNPLFAQEIALSQQSGRPLLDGTLGGLIADRLAAVEPEAAEVLPFAAALGRRLNPDLLAAVTGMHSSDLLKALNELERRTILRAADSGQYEFAHDVIRQAAYQALSEPHRRLVHLQIARHLTRGQGTDVHHASEVAYHADLGGDHALAAQACVMAGRHALRIYAYEDALTLARRGETHLESLPAATRLQRSLELLELYIHPGMETYQPHDLEEQLRARVTEARAAGMTAEVHTGLYMIGVLLYLRGQYGDALDMTVRAERAGRTADPATVVRAVADTARCLGMLGRGMTRAAQLVDEARALAEQFDIPEHGCELPLALALVRHHQGFLTEARAQLERALVLAKRDGTPWWEYYCLSRLPMIALEREAPDEALDWCRALQPVANALGNGAEAPFTRALEGLARLQRGEPDAAAIVDAALRELRAADSLWMIAYVQNLAAWAHWQSGSASSARARAHEALQAAEAIHQPSETAFAGALLVRAAASSSERAFAQTRLARFAPAAERHARLSARARRALRTLERAADAS